jgi:hypothetical protein
MRTGALLFIAIGVFTAAACNGPGPDDEECVAMGGTCEVVCTNQLTTPTSTCPTNTTCCLPSDAGPTGSGTGTGTPPATDAATKD